MLWKPSIFHYWLLLSVNKHQVINEYKNLLRHHSMTKKCYELSNNCHTSNAWIDARTQNSREHLVSLNQQQMNMKSQAIRQETSGSVWISHFTVLQLWMHMPDISTVTAWLYPHFKPWARVAPHIRACGCMNCWKDVAKCKETKRWSGCLSDSIIFPKCFHTLALEVTLYPSRNKKQNSRLQILM